MVQSTFFRALIEFPETTPSFVQVLERDVQGADLLQDD